MTILKSGAYSRAFISRACRFSIRSVVTCPLQTGPAGV
ncbi:hypothetical protein DM50_2871 [Burkholderia mallei]|nr:gp27 domain protein [Burkholderia mallei]KOS91662.1 hypothetical protein DM53_4382 [Burkholderia mallei]KOT01463.1 hypothetical protein DM50_2871 [Burkholderia mallei]KOT11198.1 hypothetical protein DM77_2968 [Burkholderia mallei]KOT22048.1 hypothetical protein DM52_2057 [Burkholderia mallei]